MNDPQKSMVVNTLRWISLGALAIALLPAVVEATLGVANAIENFRAERRYKVEHAEWQLARDSWWRSLSDEQRAAWSLPGSGSSIAAQMRRENRGEPEPDPSRISRARLTLKGVPPEPVEPTRQRGHWSWKDVDPLDALEESWYGLPVAAAAWWVRRWILLG